MSLPVCRVTWNIVLMVFIMYYKNKTNKIKFQISASDKEIRGTWGENRTSCNGMQLWKKDGKMM